MSSILSLLLKYPLGLTDPVIMTELEYKWKMARVPKKRKLTGQKGVVHEAWWDPAAGASSPFVQAWVGETTQCSPGNASACCTLCPARNLLSGTSTFFSRKVTRQTNRQTSRQAFFEFVGLFL
jgi:hypothetical protein